jgi:hypothetical protein
MGQNYKIHIPVHFFHKFFTSGFELRARHREWPFSNSTRKVGFLVLYEADMILKFWLPMGGLGLCRVLKSDFDDTGTT